MASEKTGNRFGDASEDEWRELVESAVPANTKRSTKFWVGVFNEFCEEKGIVIDLKTCGVLDLNRALCRFYRGLRTKNSQFYKKASYLAARASLGRYVTVDLQRNFNLFQTLELQESNRVLNAVLIENKMRGEPQTVHKEALLPEDQALLEAYFSDVLVAGDAVKLSQFCWYNITTHFGLRAAEVQLQLKKADISFLTDGDGHTFCALTRDFMSKNARGGINGREFSSDGRIYNTMQVEAFKLLISKCHPEIDRLFQRAKVGKQLPQQPVWYMKSPLGHNILRDMMPRLSTSACLSRRYTNHCLHATVVTKLKEAGVEDRKICRITGHKNAQSLENYERSTEKEIRAVSKILDVPHPDMTPPPPLPESETLQPANSLKLINAPNAVFHKIVINVSSSAAGEPSPKIAKLDSNVLDATTDS